jgi:three-Cys-motif partner protein
VPTQKSEFVEDPSDGLPARAVRDWTRRKHHYLDRYMDIFSVGMKKWDRRAYVDLFAGPGRCFEKETGTFYDGSPLLAFRHPFTDHVYVELDIPTADALRKRCESYRGARNVTVMEGDCNSRIDQVARLLPSSGITLAFIDPTNWQIRLPAVAKLAATGRVDLIVSFFAGMMERVMHLDEQPKLDSFFGTHDWKTETRFQNSAGRPSMSGLLACYREQMTKLGYLDVMAGRELAVKNTTNRTMYLITFFSKHERGYDFWDKITAEDERGQLAIDW